jgi:streptogramin lyase
MACRGEVLPGPECEAGQADGLDNDCDGAVDEDCLLDLDGDGYSPPEDCDESDPAVHHEAQETCNGLDDNCNGLLDEGVTNSCGTCGEVPEEVCADALDNDCDGLVDEDCDGCSGNEARECYRGPDGTQGIGRCDWGIMNCIEGQFWSACTGDILPEPEVCDGIDNDCDGDTDEQWAIGSDACGFCDSVELCDFIDNDCDGLTDEGLRNACGQCLDEVEPEIECDGLDNDCDGLINEGLLTSCGTCPDVPCYTEEWDTPGLCDEDHRICDGVIPVLFDPDSITLSQGTMRTPFIYIAVTGRDQVAKLNTNNGAKVWQMSSHGDHPSRTDVALDNSVWVSNLGNDSIWSPEYSNGVHLDVDGNRLCGVDAVGRASGVAIDGDGNVWIGTHEGHTLYKVHGAETNNTDCAVPPCCRLLGTLDVGVAVDGTAIDGNGFLWTASHPITVKVDTATMQIVDNVSNPTHYGIAIDQNTDVWFGGWSGSGVVHKISSQPPYSIFSTNVYDVTAVTVDQDGYVWGSSYGTDEVVKIDPVTGNEICSNDVYNGTNPHGIAMDDEGKIWVSNRYGGYVNVYDLDCNHLNSYPVDPGQELLAYSDMTGMQLGLITTREGHWIQNFDSGYVSPRWHSASWQALVPPDTSVTVSFVSAGSEAELSTSPSPVCGPFDNSPADLLSCPDLQGRRWLSADVQLNTTQNEVRPTFSFLGVSWSR